MMYIVQRENRGERGGGERRRRSLEITVSRRGQAHCSTHHNCMDLEPSVTFFCLHPHNWTARRT